MEILDRSNDLEVLERSHDLEALERLMAIVDLAYATGTLLGAAKVQWEPIE